MLLTRLPLELSIATSSPFDLHALGTPPAFILSQDQTLRLIPIHHSLLKSDLADVQSRQNLNTGALALSLPLFSC